MDIISFPNNDFKFEQLTLGVPSGLQGGSYFTKIYNNDGKVYLQSPSCLTKQGVIKTGKKINGPIRILTHLRYFGFCFNPVSFYYCFDTTDSKLEMIMAEVTNTPWNERHSYIIDKKMLKGSKKNLVAELEKKLHVSPFWGMDHQYEWLFSEPDESLLVNMKNFKSKVKVFDATLTMKRKALTIKNLLISVLRFPFITLIVVYRIHWQALKLWIKKAPFFVHPSKIES